MLQVIELHKIYNNTPVQVYAGAAVSAGMYAGNSLDRPSVYPQMLVPVRTLWAGADRNPQCRWRYEPSVPVETLSAGGGTSPLCRWPYEPSVPVETLVPVAVRALCAGGGRNLWWRYRYGMAVSVRRCISGIGMQKGGGVKI